MQEPGLRTIYVRTNKDLKLDPERPEYHRVTLQRKGTIQDDDCAGLEASSTGVQISSRLLSMRSANALLELPQLRVRYGYIDVAEVQV